MGMCYTTIFRLKFKDEKDALKKIVSWMDKSEKDHSCRFGRENFQKQGITPDTLGGAIRIVLAGWERTPYKESEPDDEGFVTYENDFDASYGWEFVLLDFATTVATLAADGSYIYIEPDDEFYEFKVMDGKLTETD